MDCSMPGFPVLHYLLEFAQTHVYWVDNTIQPSHPLSPLLPSVFASIRVFSTELALHISWPKYWSASFNISPSNEYPGVISVRIEWFDFLSLQRTLRVFSSTTVQKHQFFQCSAFLIVQISHPYMTTRKTIALMIWTFVSKVMSLLFNTLSRFVTAFLPVQFLGREEALEKGYVIYSSILGLPCGSYSKEPICMRETWVWYLG